MFSLLCRSKRCSLEATTKSVNKTASQESGSQGVSRESASVPFTPSTQPSTSPRHPRRSPFAGIHFSVPETAEYEVNGKNVVLYWICLRRETDGVEVHRQLHRFSHLYEVFGIIRLIASEIPELPSRSIFLRRTQSVVRKRAAAIEEAFDVAKHIPEVVSSVAFKQLVSWDPQYGGVSPPVAAPTPFLLDATDSAGTPIGSPPQPMPAVYSMHDIDHDSEESWFSAQECLSDYASAEEPASAVPASAVLVVPPPAHAPMLQDTKLLVRDANTGRVFRTNGQGLTVDTEIFEGRVCVFTRTHEQDPFFAGKKRRIEVQIQGRFKKQPDGQVFIGAEVERDLKLSRGWGAVSRLLLAFCRKFNSNLHGNISGTPETDERPHMTLPLGHLVDTWIETPEGEVPPRLGSMLPPGDAKRMKKAFKPDHQFDLSATYTFTWHSMYFDLENWQVANIPGARGSSLAGFWDDMPLTILAYSVKDSKDHHGPSVRTSVFGVDIVHESSPRYPALLELADLHA